MVWDEDPYDTYEPTAGTLINTQFVNVFFIDVDDGLESIGEEIVDAKLPYERVMLANNTWFTATENHMVRCTARFTHFLRVWRR